jgi:AcrR family transcriptional regulator
MRAVIAATAERGYAAVTVADVVARARVSRTSFYDQFTDKEDCLLQAAAHGRRLMFGRISDEVEAEPAQATDEQTLRAGLRGLLGFLHDEPAFATVFYLDVPAVGRRGADRLAEAQQKLAARTAVWHARARSRHPDWPAVPVETFRALAGATEALVRDKIRAGRTDELPSLEDLIVELHLRLLTHREAPQPTAAAGP